MSRPIKTLFLFTLVLSIFCQSQSVNYTIELNITCLQPTVSGCSKWQSTGVLQPQTVACFPGETVILTTNGRKRMEDLQVGDEVYAFNSKTKRNQFTRVMAWLHRDVEKMFQYVEMREQTGNRVYASAFHNVAVRGQGGQVGFVFGKDTNQQSLYNSKGVGSFINKTSMKILRGVYSPYTELGNFYIGNEENPEELYLVHCFAHISNPQTYQLIFYLSIKFCGWFGLNSQPISTQYRHPLSIFFQSMFPFLVQKQQHYVGYDQITINQQDPPVGMPSSSSAAAAAAQRRRKLINMLVSMMTTVLQTPYL